MKLFKISVPQISNIGEAPWLAVAWHNEWWQGRQFRDIVSKIVTSLLRMKNWNSVWNFEVYIRRWMYTQYLSHIQSVSFIGLKTMKACIHHSNDRHRAQGNLKGISYMNSVLGRNILLSTWCELEWHRKPTWRESRVSIFWLPHNRTNWLRRLSVACGCPLEAAGRI